MVLGPAGVGMMASDSDQLAKDTTGSGGEGHNRVVQIGRYCAVLTLALHNVHYRHFRYDVERAVGGDFSRDSQYRLARWQRARTAGHKSDFSYPRNHQY